MDARIFAALLGGCVWLVSSQPAYAQADVWTVADVVRMARARASRVHVSRQRAAVARARVETLGRAPDPTVYWEREETFAEAGPNNQDIFALTWPLDLSGRRHGERALATARLERARAEVAVAERAAIADALSAFHGVVAARQRVEAASAHVAALDEVDRVLTQRERTGSASGYARARIRIEAELARSRLASRRAEARGAEQRLAARVAPDVGSLPELQGDLETHSPQSVEALVKQARRQHPALRHARAAQAAADDAEGAADTAWIPTVSLTGGYKVARTTQTERGYAAGISMGLPVFSRDRALHRRARAERSLSRAQARALKRRLRRQIAQARSRLVASRKELVRFGRATRTRVETLLRGARVSYEEGHRPLFEVLDAQRAASGVRLRCITLALEAKRAEIRLRRLTRGWR